jgi:hypothetical protein
MTQAQVVPMPDIEDALIDYLVADTGVGAVVVDRIYAELPRGVVYPAVTVRLLIQRSGVPRWLQSPATVEVAGWAHRDDAHGRKNARAACETAVAAINALRNAVLGDVVVVGPIATTGPRSVPDQLEPGVVNPRWIAEVSLAYHPR